LKEELRSIPEIREVKRALNKMKQETAPGITGLISDMLKALLENALKHVALIIQKLWKGEDDHEVWHVIFLIALYKVKGKTNDPNNCRGVCLQELTSKVISSIVSTRLLAILVGNNVEEQFTTLGCQQAMHGLRAALSTTRAHGIYTYVIFGDLGSQGIWYGESCIALWNPEEIWNTSINN
jgi:hypothetical protein